jgi:hypothetical protein
MARIITSTTAHHGSARMPAIIANQRTEINDVQLA